MKLDTERLVKKYFTLDSTLTRFEGYFEKERKSLQKQLEELLLSYEQLNVLKERRMQTFDKAKDALIAVTTQLLGQFEQLKREVIELKGPIWTSMKNRVKPHVPSSAALLYA